MRGGGIFFLTCRGPLRNFFCDKNRLLIHGGLVLVITLTTDFGWSDEYVGAMKGVIHTIAPHARIVDITHGIPPHDVDRAAFALKCVHRFFPAGTIHVAVVDPGVGTDRAALLVSTEHHRFLAPDNGLLQYVLDSYPEAAVFKLTNPEFFLRPESGTFHGRDVFAPAAAHLSTGVPPERLGVRFNGPTRGTVPRPVVEGGTIRGQILFFDGFGNAVTDIDAAMLSEGTVAEVRVGRTVLSGIVRTYGDARPGESAAVVGSHGHLEIAVNRGSAQAFLGLSRGDAVYVLMH